MRWRSKERIEQDLKKEQISIKKCDQSYMDPEAFVNESASIISVSLAPDSLDLFSHGGSIVRYTKIA